MGRDLLHGSFSVGFHLNEDGVVLLEERRGLELDDEGSSFLEGFDHIVVVINGGVENRDSVSVHLVGEVQGLLGGS